MRNAFFAIFNFSKKERVAIFLLLIISSLVWIIPSFFSTRKINPEWITVTPLELSERKTLLISRADSTYKRNNRWNDKINYSRKATLFNFDPNHVSREELIELGFPERVANSMINYRLKGGKFKTPDDLRKVYGLSPDLADQIIPYAVIKDLSNEIPVSIKQQGLYFKPARLNINVADSNAFASLPGIGNRLSSRIVRYRDRLGGFYELDQLKEVYGINDSMVKQLGSMIYHDDIGIKKININELNYEELSRHPYIGYSKARLLIAFRKANGRIKNRHELLRAAMFDSIGVDKILPYCLFD
jgi:competence ComEA-like helix-hairpin-helix protein